MYFERKMVAFAWMRHQNLSNNLFVNYAIEIKRLFIDVNKIHIMQKNMKNGYDWEDIFLVLWNARFTPQCKTKNNGERVIFIWCNIQFIINLPWKLPAADFPPKWKKKANMFERKRKYFDYFWSKCHEWQIRFDSSLTWCIFDSFWVADENQFTQSRSFLSNWWWCNRVEPWTKQVWRNNLVV